jgi:SAM-dependent methyltransferase
MVAESSPKPAWYQQGVGERLITAEKDELADLLPRLYGYHLLFLGDPGLTALTQSSLISHRILINPQTVSQAGEMSYLQAEIESLPLRNDSVDVVVLSHTLEQVANPHEVLRETHRVLIPEGHVVITGFNPYSLWGAWHLYQRFSGKSPKHGKMLGLNRVRDWLKLLNFQIVGGKMCYFRPPLNQEKVNEKLSFMDKWGNTCCPYLGGAYSLLAVKRVIPLTPIRAKWRKEKPIWQGAEGFPKPTTTVRNETK